MICPEASCNELRRPAKFQVRDNVMPDKWVFKTRPFGTVSFPFYSPVMGLIRLIGRKFFLEAIAFKLPDET